MGFVAKCLILASVFGEIRCFIWVFHCNLKHFEPWLPILFLVSFFPELNKYIMIQPKKHLGKLRKDNALWKEHQIFYKSDCFLAPAQKKIRRFNPKFNNQQTGHGGKFNQHNSSPNSRVRSFPR